jgi:limonene-1,2-epoxide hydrolase
MNEQAGYPQQSSPYYGAHVSSSDAGAQPPPPPAYVGAQPYSYPQGASYPGTPAPPVPPVQRPNRRRLWIILGTIIGGIVVIALILVLVIGAANRSTPAKTLTAFCNALKSGDYQTAYNQLDSGLQSKFGSEGAFATAYASNGGLGKIAGCTVTNVDDGAGTGTITYTLAQRNSLIVDYKLADENGSSKIVSQQPRSTPTLTLTTFCTALKAADYQTAYNQLSSAEQSQITEAQLATALSTNMVTNCKLSNINDAAGTGTVSYTFAHGNSSIIAYTLINENGTWKINSGRQIG